MDTQIIYVRQDAVGNNDGTSWSDAYTDLQSALFNAPSGSEIWVAKGIYKPTADQIRGISFFLSDRVNLYGGFFGDETTLEQRNWLENQTILSGDIGIENEPSDNSYSVVTAIGSADRKLLSVLDGFTIRDGNADGINTIGGVAAGGGIYISNSQITLAHLNITSNQAFWGGAIYNTFADTTIIDTDISHNQAFENGGGIYSNKSALTLTHTILSNNGAGNLGGGINIDTSENVHLTHVLINRNTADNGGGIYNSHSRSTLVNVTLSQNIANTGGGIENVHGDSQMTIENSILWGNQATSIANSATSQIGNIQEASTQIKSSIIEGGYGDVGDRNLAIDPLFVNPDSGDFHLQSQSPAIDRGNNQALPIEVTSDLDNNPRIANGIVDLGAYEWVATERISFKFDAAQYGASYPDLIVAIGDDFDALSNHYLQHGQFEGRSLDDFDELRYLASYDDLIDRLGNDPQAATVHYITDGFAEHRDPNLFDRAGYIASYEDLVQSFGDDLDRGTEHYLNFGYSERRSRYLFDPLSYINRYSDLSSAYENDLSGATRHYLEHGFSEGRHWS
jgi:predicted outer membrane repeat protein